MHPILTQLGSAAEAVAAAVGVVLPPVEDLSVMTSFSDVDGWSASSHSHSRDAFHAANMNPRLEPFGSSLGRRRLASKMY